MRLAGLCTALLLAFLAVSASGQGAPSGVAVRSQVLTIDSSRLFPETVVGQSILAAIAEERRAFAAENQRLAAEFREEELELTARRSEMDREDFARLAEEFDEKVRAARLERDAEQVALDARAEEQERLFLNQVTPILGGIMTEAGAVVLIEAGTVLLRNDAVDITEIAIARINEAARQGQSLEGNPRNAPEGGVADPAE